MSDFSIGARLIASDGTTVVRDFHDHAAGVDILGPLVLPRFPARRTRISEWRGSHGDFPIGRPSKGPGEFVLSLLLTPGPAWPSVEVLYSAIEADLWAEDDFFLELDLEGVAYRYRTEVPVADDTLVTALELSEASMECSFTFICQPNPTVTVSP